MDKTDLVAVMEMKARRVRRIGLAMCVLAMLASAVVAAVAPNVVVYVAGIAGAVVGLYGLGVIGTTIDDERFTCLTCGGRIVNGTTAQCERCLQTSIDSVRPFTPETRDRLDTWRWQ